VSGPEPARDGPRRPIVIAVGGNALARGGEPVDAAHQRDALQRAGPALAGVIGDRPVVVTHGNGPQVGHLGAAARAGGDDEPLDVLDALSQGLLGYLVTEELSARLPQRSVVGLLTRVEVDAADPAFAHPSKPVGPRGPGPRALVASPEPQRIVELAAIRTLLHAGHVVVAVGGGGVPVTVDRDGVRRGIEAVLDKDLASALLAVGLDAGTLLLLTDIDGVRSGWGTAAARTLREVHVDDLDPADFEAGSMRPKVEAARRFVLATGRPAAIGALAEAPAVLSGERGTRVLPRP